MINFIEIGNLRDRLVQSLWKWRSGEDGFYRSSPIAKGHTPPSFTNTGIVLQAFNESRQVAFAQVLSEDLLDYLRRRECTPFPHEKATEQDPKQHVMCNSWPIFAILDSFPTRIRDIYPLCEWFLKTQKYDGSWSLLPDEETKYPIFTAYSLSALLQFYDFSCKVGFLRHDDNKRLVDAIRKGFKWLFDNRSEAAIKEGLLLWPASANDLQANPVSFSTSAVSMHMISKASRLLQEPEYGSRVVKTLQVICDSFRSEEEGFAVGNLRINLWDQIHVNESSLNYFFAFFTPLSLTTLLRFAKSPNFFGNEKYYGIISYLADWILKSELHVEGLPGIKGGQFIDEVKTWSTAQAVIVLSRLLDSAYWISSSLHDPNVKKLEARVQAVDEIVRDTTVPDRWEKVVRLVFNGILVLLCVFSYFAFSDRVQSAWPNIEGKIWLAGIILVVIFAAFGSINVKKVRESVVRFIFALRRPSRQIGRLKKLGFGK